MSTCFTCRTRPAGNDYGGPHTAFCATCQPRNPHPPLRGAQCRCAACSETFATLTDFDAHQVRRDGVFTGECLDPAALGLELAGHVWGTPEGNARRVHLATRLPRRPPANLAA
jgi:hypothetical protein